MQDELKALRINPWPFQQPFPHCSLQPWMRNKGEYLTQGRSNAWIWAPKHLWGLEALPFPGLILEFEEFLAFSLSAASQLPGQVISCSKEKFLSLLLSSKFVLAAPSRVTLVGELCIPWQGCATGQRCFPTDLGWLRTLWVF